MKTRKAALTDLLSDSELLDRESDQHDEFLRLEKAEPQPRNTTFRLMEGSRALIHAWELWIETSVTARLRGLLPRPRDRS